MVALVFVAAVTVAILFVVVVFVIVIVCVSSIVVYKYCKEMLCMIYYLLRFCSFTRIVRLHALARLHTRHLFTHKHTHKVR